MVVNDQVVATDEGNSEDNVRKGVVDHDEFGLHGCPVDFNAQFNGAMNDDFSTCDSGKVHRALVEVFLFNS